VADVRPGYFELVFDRDLDLSLTRLRGVGPKTAERLLDRDIDDQAELLLTLPRTYHRVHRFTPPGDIVEARAERVELSGRVVDLEDPGPHSRAPLRVDVVVGGTSFELVWFNSPYPGFASSFSPGDWVTFEGDVDWDYGTPSLAHPTTDLHDDRPPEPPPQVEIEPNYPSMEGIPDSRLRSAIEQAAERLLPRAVDILPDDLLAERDLGTVRSALETLHVLCDIREPAEFDRRLRRARTRLVYEEFYTLQRRLADEYTEERRAGRAPECTTREMGRALVRALPFELTEDQKAASAELADDLARRAPMRRLLQGDVGSGKTVVAFSMAAICIDSGYQVALMAPTELLARQHLRRARDLFEDFDLQIRLLAGSLSGPERRAAHTDLESGATDFAIGTHALFSEEVSFDDLGLAVVDEQHKFGVDQRERLLEKGRDPHLLAMTATPIPRSLAHSVFGDLDLTLIREKPPGRKPVRTFLRDRTSAADVYRYVRDRIDGTDEQAYFVYPLVERSEGAPDRRSAVEAAERLANGPMSGLRTAVLHGQMEDDAKHRTMEQFADGTIDLLCATTVVEVGMDVSTATLMVVESPEVFGLSQLHQLRGRVGRGRSDSMCILLAGYGLNPEARERLQSFADMRDGFELAEKDLELRGPGEFLGERQSGRAEFRFGDLLRDAELLEAARRDTRRRRFGDAGAATR